MARDSFDESKNTKKKVTKKKTEEKKPQSSSVTKPKTTTTKADKIASKSTFLGGGAPVQKVEQAASKPTTVKKPANTKKQTVTKQDQINQKMYGTTKPNVTTKTQRTKRDTKPVTSKSQRKANAEANMNLKQRNIRDTAPVQSRRTATTTAAQRQKMGMPTQQDLQDARASRRELANSVRSSVREATSEENKGFMQRQKSGTLTTSDKKRIEQTNQRRAEIARNTGAAAKKAVQDTGSGYAQSIYDLTELTAGNKNGTQAKAMKMGLDPVRDRRRIAELEREQKYTAAESKRRRDELFQKQEQRQAEWDERTKNAKGLEKAWYGAVESGTGMVADTLVGAATGTGQFGALASMGLRTYGSSANQARKEGATDKEARLYGLAQSAKEVGTELMFQGAGLAKAAYGKGGLSLADKSANILTRGLTGLKADAVGAGVRALGGTAEENIEELAGWMADPLIKELTYGKAVRNRMKENLRANIPQIGSDADAAHVASYFSTPKFTDDLTNEYVKSGMSRDKASSLAAEMRDYYVAYYSGDKGRLDALEEDLAAKLSGQDKLSFRSWSMDELKDTFASTTLLTLATGLPGAVTTSVKGNQIFDSDEVKAVFGNDAVRKVADAVKNTSNREMSLKAETMEDRLNSGKDLTGTQKYDLYQGYIEKVNETAKKARASNGVVENARQEQNLVPTMGVDRAGNTVYAKETQREYDEKYAETAVTAESLRRFMESDNSISDDEIRRTDAAIKAVSDLHVGGLTIGDAHEFAYGNNLARETLKIEEGIDLDRYIVRKADGTVDLAATNEATENALFRINAENAIKAAQAETEVYIDDTRGNIDKDLLTRFGNNGQAVWKEVNKDLDPRDLKNYLTNANAASYFYSAGRNTDMSVDTAVNRFADTFKTVDKSVMKRAFAAGARDRIIANTPGYGQTVESGSNIQLKKTEPVITGQLIMDDDVVLADSDQSAYLALAMSTNTNIHIVSNLNAMGKDGKPIINQATGLPVQLNGMSHGNDIYLNMNEASEKNLGYVFMHEMTHQIKQYAPNEYLALENLVRDKWFNKDAVGMQAAIKQRMDLYSVKGGQQLTEEEAVEEIIADAMAEAMDDPNFAAEVCEQDINLGEKILESIRGALRSIRQIFANSDYKNDRFHNSLLSYLGILDEAEKMWLNALATAKQNKADGLIADWQDKANKQNAPRLSVTEEQTESMETTISDADRETLNNEGIEELDDGTTARYSVTSWGETNKDKKLKALVAVGHNKEAASKWIDDVNSIASIILDDPERLDYEADRTNKFLKPNGDYYKYTLDASTLCDKRRIYQGTYNAIQHIIPNAPLMQDDVVRIRTLLKNMDHKAPCGICYVESQRKNLGQYAKEWYDSYARKDEIKLADVTTSDGLKELKKTNPEVASDFEKAMAAKGVSSPKVVKLRTDYREDIMRMRPATIEYLNSIGGLRFHSFSDFETPHLIDTMQAVMDMATKNLMGMAYAKVPNFAAVFGPTGIKINLSLIAKTDENGNAVHDENGRLVFDSVEGIPFEEASKWRDAYPDNVAFILVGKDKEHTLEAINDDRVDFVIPFHRSKWSAEDMRRLGLVGYEDFATGHQENGVFVSEFWDYNKTGKENAERYLEVCKEKGVTPIFEQLLKENEDGTYSLKEDGSTDNYWKLLVEGKMYNHFTKKGAPQKPVQPNFNMDEARRVLNEYEGGANTLPVADDVVKAFIKEYKQNHPDVEIADAKMSISIEYDDAYMDAVNSGNMDEAQRLVDEAANMAGYTERVYHGTGEYFNVFRLGREGIHLGNIEQAEQVARNRYHDRSRETRYKWGEIKDRITEMDTETRQSLINRLERTSAHAPIFDGDISDAESVKAYAEDALQKYYGTQTDINNKSVLMRTFDRNVGENVMRMYARLDNPFVINGDILDWTPWNIADTLLRKADGNTEYRDDFTERRIDISGSDLNLGKWTRKAVEQIANGEVKGDEAWRLLVGVLEQAGGYHGIKYLNQFEGDKNSYSYIALNRSDVKLADPVTYAEDGSVIPLSERFDPTNNDIRYSLPTQDSDGKILTDGQMEYFKNSQARDIFGRLVPVYHATDEGGFTIFDPMKSDDYRSLFFTNKRDVANTYVEDKYLSDEDRIGSDDNTEERSGYYQVYLNLENPFIIEGHGQPWNDIVDGGSVFPAYSYVRVRDASWYREDAENSDEMYAIGQRLRNGDDSRAKAEELSNSGLIEIEIFDGEEKHRSMISSDAESIGTEIANIFGIDDLEIVSGLAENIAVDLEIDNSVRFDATDMRNTIGEYGYSTREWAEFAADEGYDGVIFRNIIDIDDKTEIFDSEEEAASDVYVAFSSNQVKDINNENPTENPDIRYSITPEDEAMEWLASQYELDDVPLDDEQAEEGRIRMAKSKKDFIKSKNALWNERWLTEGKVINVKSVRKSIKDLVTGVMANSTTDRKYKSEVVDNTLVDAKSAYWLMKEGKHSEAAELLWNSAVKMIENVDFVEDLTFNQYKDLRDYMRTTSFKLGEEYWSDVDFSAFRKRNFGRIKLVKGETNIDEIYQELQEKWPEWFDEDEQMTAPDQLLHIEEVLDAIQPYKIAYSSEEAEQLAGDIADELYDIVYQGEEYKSIADTFKERYDAKTKALKARHEEALAKVRARSDELLAAEKEKTSRQKERAELWKSRTFEEKAKRQKDKDVRKKAKYFGKISDNIDWLSTRLLNETKDKNIPEGFRRSLAHMLMQFDMQTEKSKELEKKYGPAKKTLQMRELKSRLEKIANEDDTGEFRYDGYLFYMMDALAEKVDGKTIDALDTEDLIAIDTMLKSIVHNFRNYNKIRLEEEKVAIANIGDNIIDAMAERIKKYGKRKSYGNSIRGYIDRLINEGEETPIYFFERLDPTGQGIGAMYKELRRGEDRHIQNMKFLRNRFKAMFSDYFNEKKPGSKLESWRDTSQAQTFNLKNGSITLNPAQIMSLYCLTKRQQALGHILGAGIVASPISFGAKMREKFKGNEEQVDSVMIEYSEVQEIIATLTEDQVHLADEMQALMNNEMAAWGNETSLELHGIKLFREKDYFPIKSSNEVLDKSADKRDVNEKIKNFGFTKPLTRNANNAIMIDDIFSVVADHCNKMSLYNSMAIPITDFMRVYNYKQRHDDGSVKSVQAAIGEAFTRKANSYIMKFISDVNGNTKTRSDAVDDLMNKALANYKKASIGLNGRVALQQITAIFRARMVIDGKYFIGTKLISPEDQKEMFEHCPIALWKSWGHYDMDMGRDIEDIMMNNDWSKMDTVTMGVYGMLDNMAWGKIWQAVKKEIKAKHPEVQAGSDEFFRLCNERASEIFDKTQVVDSIFHRSDTMRSKNTLTKMATSFMAEPTLTYNVFRDSLVKAHELRKDGNTAEAGKLLLKMMRVLTVNAIAVGAAAAIWDVVRGKGADDDDDDENLMEKGVMALLTKLGGTDPWTKDEKNAKDLWLINFLNNFSDNAPWAQWNNIYFVKDIVSLKDGWGTSNMALEGWETLFKGASQAKKKLTEGSDKSWYDIWMNIAGGIGYVTGYPVKTFLRDTKAILEKFGVEVFAADGSDESTTLMDSIANKMGYRPIDKKGSSEVKVKDSFLAQLGIGKTEEEKEQDAFEKKTKDIADKYADLSGEEKDKKVWSSVTTYLKEQNEDKGVADMVTNGDYITINKYRQMYLSAGGNAEYFDNRILAESKKALKKSIKYGQTNAEIDAQDRVKNYMLSHGVTEQEISEIAYKSATAKDMKIAFIINDKDAMLETLEPLVNAGLTYEDLERIWENRNRIDIMKYKSSKGRYADRLKSTGKFIWPTDGVITSHFGYRNAPTAGASSNHPAIDIGAPQGTAVVAADGGVVISAGANGGYGNSVGIKHDNGMITWYNHLYDWNVKVGDTVAQGQQIAQVGSTGISTGPHLDFKIMDTNGNPVDPEKYLQ